MLRGCLLSLIDWVSRELVKHAELKLFRFVSASRIENFNVEKQVVNDVFDVQSEVRIRSHLSCKKAKYSPEACFDKIHVRLLRAQQLHQTYAEDLQVEAMLRCTVRALQGRILSDPVRLQPQKLSLPVLVAYEAGKKHPCVV